MGWTCRAAFFVISQMFKSKLFWSDYFETQAQRQGPGPRRFRSAAKWAGIVVSALAVVLFFVILLLRWMPVPTSAFMLGHKLRGNPVAYRWVPLKKISPALAVSVVASEDQRFPDHWGFDFQAISDALEENRRRSTPRGASTISQQVTKNLFLWSGRSWVRKGIEAGLTVAIEMLWSKRRILEVYLNIAQFGPDIFGADAAGRRFFGLPPSRLNGYQAALLAAALPNPMTHRVSSPTPYVSQRAADIQVEVRRLGGVAYLSAIGIGAR